MDTVKVIVRKTKGGPGSGNWGHSGRPGMQGGSAPGGGSSDAPSATNYGKLSLPRHIQRELAADGASNMARNTREHLQDVEQIHKGYVRDGKLTGDYRKISQDSGIDIANLARAVDTLTENGMVKLTETPFTKILSDIITSRVHAETASLLNYRERKNYVDIWDNGFFGRVTAREKFVGPSDKLGFMQQLNAAGVRWQK